MQKHNPSYEEYTKFLTGRGIRKFADLADLTQFSKYKRIIDISPLVGNPTSKTYSKYKSQKGGKIWRLSISSTSEEDFASEVLKLLKHSVNFILQESEKDQRYLSARQGDVLRSWNEKEKSNVRGTLNQGLRDYIFQVNNDLLDGAETSRIVQKILEPYIGWATDRILRNSNAANKSDDNINETRSECFKNEFSDPNTMAVLNSRQQGQISPIVQEVKIQTDYIRIDIIVSEYTELLRYKLKQILPDDGWNVTVQINDFKVPKIRSGSGSKSRMTAKKQSESQTRHNLPDAYHPDQDQSFSQGMINQGRGSRYGGAMTHSNHYRGNSGTRYSKGRGGNKASLQGGMPFKGKRGKGVGSNVSQRDEGSHRGGRGRGTKSAEHYQGYSAPEQQRRARGQNKKGKNNE